jgi:hypothetical protein
MTNVSLVTKEISKAYHASVTRQIDDFAKILNGEIRAMNKCRNLGNNISYHVKLNLCS